MSKRPTIDLLSLTTEQAAPMVEATQRSAESPKARPLPFPIAKQMEQVRTENLEALAFKVPPVFRKRFRQRAVMADLKLNELLFEALTAWEEKKGIKG